MLTSPRSADLPDTALADGASMGAPPPITYPNRYGGHVRTDLEPKTGTRDLVFFLSPMT
ncbi:hypothetical protein LZ30DRAFT_722906 [Colletotrichum cereale]|nr:hypothetical protein LZ30DRAFT_722906 [Colletotrichum cereale]